VRLFVALDLNDDIRAALEAAIAALRPLAKNARWSKPEGMHVTLKFIGHVGPEKLDPIRVVLAMVRSGAPVELQIRGLEFFPDTRRPRVIACGIAASANLAPLASEIERSLEPLGIPREERKFTPHVTLGRQRDFRGEDDLVHAAETVASRDFGSTRATEFHLYESFTKPSGSEYEKLASFDFVKGAA